MTERAVLLAKLAAVVAATPEPESLTARLCEASRRLAGADGASITVDSASANRITLHATDEVAARLEDLHDVLGEGPSTHAFATAAPVVVTMAQAAQAWPLFGEAAARQTPATSLYAFPMRSGSAVLGVLSLYCGGSGDLAIDLADAAFLADALGAALLHDSTGLSDLGSGGSWSSRAEIHQATGMVVAQLAVPVNDALALLRAHAFALDETLATVAHSVVTRELVFRRESPP